ASCHLQIRAVVVPQNLESIVPVPRKVIGAILTHAPAVVATPSGQWRRAYVGAREALVVCNPVLGPGRIVAERSVFLPQCTGYIICLDEFSAPGCGHACGCARGRSAGLVSVRCVSLERLAVNQGVCLRAERRIVAHGT